MDLQHEIAAARALYDKGRFDDAAAQLGRALGRHAVHPLRLPAQALRIEAQRRGRHLDEARSGLPALLDAAPMNASYHLLAAACHADAVEPELVRWQLACQKMLDSLGVEPENILFDDFGG